MRLSDFCELAECGGLLPFCRGLARYCTTSGIGLWPHPGSTYHHPPAAKLLWLFHGRLLHDRKLKQNAACGLRGENGQKKAKRNAYDTWYSQAVPHPSTNQAQRCLTSQIGRDAVFSTWYGRRRPQGYKTGLYAPLSPSVTVQRVRGKGTEKSITNFRVKALTARCDASRGTFLKRDV